MNPFDSFVLPDELVDDIFDMPFIYGILDPEIFADQFVFDGNVPAFDSSIPTFENFADFIF